MKLNLHYDKGHNKGLKNENMWSYTKREECITKFVVFSGDNLQIWRKLSNFAP